MNIKKTLLLTAATALGFAAAEACTSWVIHSSATKSGLMTVNKCRDTNPERISADFRRSPRGWRYLQLGRLNPALPSFGMNEKGVVTTCNDGDQITVKHRRGEHIQLGSPSILRQVLVECDNAYDGAVLIRDHCRAFRRPSGGGRNHGSTLMVADAKRAFLVDVGAGYGEIKEITSGMKVISNKMHLPGVEAIGCSTLGAYLSDRARETNTRKVLNQHRENGKFTVQGTIRACRAKCGEDLKDKYPFRRITLGDTCFEIDPEFPAYLSTAYAAIGPQRHTVFLAIPMALGQLPEKVSSGKWADLAFAFRAKCGDEHPALDELYAFEAKTFPEYERTREEARRLLRAGKTAEAVELLNKCFERQFKAADELLTRLAETTPKCEDPQKNLWN